MIMFISALFGLLVSEYVWYMIKSSTLFQNYYVTYYNAYAWLEVWLTQAKYHWFGFENVFVQSGSNCRHDQCATKVDIHGRTAVYSNKLTNSDSCAELDEQNINEYISLPAGDCFIVPLFYDTGTDFWQTFYKMIPSAGFLSQTYNPVLYSTYAGYTTGDLQDLQDGDNEETYVIRIIDEELQNLYSIIEPLTNDPNPFYIADSMQPYTWNQNYLIVANPTSITKNFCLGLEWDLSGEDDDDSGKKWVPAKYITVESFAEDGNTQIALRAIKNNELPSFLCYGAINPIN